MRRIAALFSAAVDSKRPLLSAALGLQEAARVRKPRLWRSSLGGLPSVLLPPARMVHTSAVLRAAGDPTRPPALLVKVGLQPYDVLRPPPGKDLSYFLEMDRATLLETIAGREFFTRSMNKLAILNCTVSVVRSIDTAQPTVKDLGHRKVLEGTQTLAEIAGNMAGNVFVHVLPDLRLFSNIIAPAVREPHQFPTEDVLLLADGRQPEEARLGALSRMAGVAATSGHLPGGTALPLFATRSHKELVSVLTGHAAALRDGAFRGTNGGKSFCLVGARGIGKTNFMQVFMAVCWAAYPSVIPLYVTGADLTDKTSSFTTTSLLHLIFAAAAERGIVASSWDELQRELKRTNRQMLIIVDEVDQLYRVPANRPDLRDTVYDTLGALGYLGNTQWGVLGTVLCGSAAATPMLIAGRGSSVIGDAYPLLRDGVPDLNDTKFMRHVIEAADCRDVAQVEHILSFTQGAPILHERDRSKLSHVVTFVAGSVPRTIANALTTCLRAGSDGALAATLLARLFAVPTSLSEDAKSLHSLIFKMLADQNTDTVRNCIGSDGQVSLHAVEEGAWAKAFQPITRAQVVAAWKKAAMAAQPPRAAEEAYTQRLLDDLADANLIAQRLRAVTVTVWPMSVAQVVMMAGDNPAAFAPLPVSIWEKLQRVANVATIVSLAL